MQLLQIIVLATAANLPGVLSAPTVDHSLARADSQFKGRNAIETSLPNTSNLKEREDECNEKIKDQCKVKKEMDPNGYCDSPFKNPSFKMPCGFWPKKKVCDKCHF